MKLSIRRIWTKALESGKFRQTTGQLRKAEPGRHRAYCCLGVLCRVVPEYDAYLKNEAGAGWDSGTLPEEILKRAGLTERQQDALVDLNDEKGASFKEIAKWIKRHL